ncbi:hypothetical protein [Demequina lutea]|uniref:Uncharacterized protein n=1 Tax=Demequina lutea TaxID=431489 RepID=A0A7Z0CIG4_9MICO|nr:hypothetical protein [Demequina lutea]NYI42556.1 hypothetical protein [Demequina lutea]
MDGLRDPVGGKSPEIYWRRRIVAAIGVVLVIVVIYFLASSPGGKKTDVTASGLTPPVTSADPSANPSADPSAATSRPCTSADVKLTLTPNPTDFAGVALPMFNVGIKQAGPTPCRLDTAATGTELKITSGTDRIFSSLDCPTDGTINARQFLLAPAANETFQVTWDRKRTAPQCTTVTAAPGAGTYHAVLTIQGIASNDATFTLSN